MIYSHRLGEWWSSHFQENCHVYIHSKEGVISLQRLSNYLSLYLERVLDCCGAFVGRDGGGCMRAY